MNNICTITIWHHLVLETELQTMSFQKVNGQGTYGFFMGTQGMQKIKKSQIKPWLFPVETFGGSWILNNKRIFDQPLKELKERGIVSI